jgi:hypothetical protein
VSKYKKNNWMPEHNPSEEDMKASVWCIKNDIRISPMGINGEQNKWRICINVGPYVKGEKQNISPHIYDKDTIWIEYFNFCKYYYNKRNDRKTN